MLNKNQRRARRERCLKALKLEAEMLGHCPLNKDCRGILILLQEWTAWCCAECNERIIKRYAP